ncbi:hypothetical protein HNQ35_002632 [Cerasibacillus quisquiliarum]|uniref:Uncharacterized protein n=1 Tax=Cerasibacillus quisquiliarum TaxID=227865 RepID=A0A511V0P8_9BACI|nr:hypothetical protein [Cerasibacillus quisquiliarum]MBB5147414.1 hypothetical protein [Cerasibacillus quisquiliarum]GEN32475.1 hypothetical protein CQU01_27130 [Cerasibacillus quisquiliarum]
MLYLLTGKRGYRIGITNIYKVFNKSRLYRSGQGFRRLNEELLNQEISKLGAVQQTLARLCHPIYASEDNRFTVDFLLTQDDRKKGITLKELEYLIDKIKSIEGNTLREIFISVEEQSNLEKSNSKVTTKRFNRLLNRLLLGEMTLNTQLYKILRSHSYMGCVD